MWYNFAGSFGIGTIGQPTMVPEAVSYYSCPNEISVKFTCHDVGILAMLWISAPYVPAGDSIIYLAGQSSFPVRNRGPFITVLTNMTINDDENLADITSELTFTASEVESGTTITCTTYDRDNNPSEKSTVFYHAGKEQ